MKKTLLVIFVAILTITLVAEDVTFNVNMNYQVELGNFEFETDFVDVAGNFNDWAGSAPLTDDDNDGIYSITVNDLDIDFICEYKFRINGSWDTSEFPGGGANRFYTVVESENIVDHWYNDQEPPTGDPAPITFIVDDSYAQEHSGFFLKGSWNANGVYDPEWGDGIEHTAFFDDGTNGDETAEDHVWTAIVELFPDDGANTWQWGINDEEHNWIDGNFEFQVIDETPQTLIYEVPTSTEQDVTVTFQVDMNLISDVVDVYLAGDFNDWSGTATIMSDDDMDGIYSAQIVFPMGSVRFQQYKFINGTEWELIDNREFEIDDANSSQVLDVVNFNNLSPDDFITQDVTVTFQVNMINVYEVGTVTIAGDFNSWNTSDYLLSDGNSDWIYTIDIIFETGSYKYQGYKYLNDGVYEDIDNRMMEIDDTSTTQILDVVYYENNQSSSNLDAIPLISLVSNYPNPFNPSTTISFTLTSPAYLKTNIFNSKGQKVITLSHQLYKAGNHEIMWNGCNTNGETVSSGIYFFTAETAEKNIAIQKMILMR